MIKCNRCGKMNAAGIANCQQCGTPLSNNKIESGFGSRMGAPEQSELPAWLETLRAGERPAAPINNPQNFSTADLIEEGALPGWMRSERERAGDSNPTDPRMAAPSAPAFPGPQSEGGTYPSQGIAAQSLIDERSLPAWMQEGKTSTTPIPTNGIAASSLLAQDSVPDWMKTLQPQSPGPAGRPMPSPQPMQPPQPPAQVPPVKSPSSALPGPSQGLSAGDLIDPQALPDWMKQQSGSFPTTAGQSGSFPAAPGQSGSFPAPPGPSNPVAPVNNFSSGQAGQQGFSASSLLDMNSLPPWLREGGLEQSGSSSPAPAAPAYQSGSWQAPDLPTSGSWQPAPPASSLPPQTPGESGMAASSFIDMNSLPEWLRSAAGQPGTGAQPPAPGQRPAPHAVPPRVENMRVPSRPRTEWNASESSEVAANVFASMLGVASSAPQYPSAQPPAASYATPPATPQGMPPATTGGLPGGTMPAQGPGNIPAGSYQAYTPGAPGAYSAYADSAQGYYQQQGASMMPPTNAPGMPGEQKNKKRGLVEALRDWLFR